MLKTLSAIFVLMLLLLPCAHAGEYFNCDDMDHFSTEGDCVKKQAEAAALKQHRQVKQQNESGFTQQEIEMWGEPSVDSNGHVITKLPPLPAMKFLIDPSPENARAYLDWNNERMQAIGRGQALLQAMSPSQSSTQSPGQSEGALPRGVDVRNIKMVDFFFAPT